MPTCGNCEKRGVLCSFEAETKKKDSRRGTKKRKVGYEPYPTRSQQIKMIENEDPDTNSIIDDRFEAEFLDSPLIDPEKLKNILAFKKISKKAKTPDSPTPQIPAKEDMALLFAMQAFFYQKSKLPAFEQCLELSKQLLSTCYDQVLSNFSVAAAFFYLGLTLTNNNENEKSCFFFENVKLFIAQWKKRIRDQEYDSSTEGQLYGLRMEFLEVLLDLALDFTHETDLLLVLKRLMYMHFLKKNYLSLIREHEDQKLGLLNDVESIELPEFRPFLGHIKADIDQRTNNYFRMDVNVLDTIAVRYSNILAQEYRDSLVKNAVAQRKLRIPVIAQAAKLHLLL